MFKFEGQPIIVRRYLSPYATFAIFATFFGMVLMLGIVIGFMMGMQPINVHIHQPGAPLEIPSLPLPPLMPDEDWETPYIEDGLREETIEAVWTFTDINQEIKCLAMNIYFEAAFEGVEGWIAVANVTINRVKDKRFPNSICEVVWFKAVDRNTGKLTAHFSWTLDGRPDVVGNKTIYKKIYMLANAMIAEGTLDNFSDLTYGALYYHADYVTPGWSRDYNHVLTVGRHLFYTTDA